MFSLHPRHMLTLINPSRCFIQHCILYIRLHSRVEREGAARTVQTMSEEEKRVGDFCLVSLINVDSCLLSKEVLLSVFQCCFILWFMLTGCSRSVCTPNFGSFLVIPLCRSFRIFVHFFIHFFINICLTDVLLHHPDYIILDQTCTCVQDKTVQVCISSACLLPCSILQVPQRNKPGRQRALPSCLCAAGKSRGRQAWEMRGN